jgi:hypothetical protein
MGQRELERYLCDKGSLRVRDHVKGFSFPGFEVVERLTQREDLAELIVRPTEGRRRNLQRFRVFSPPLNASAEIRTRFLRKANNTLDALAKTGEHPNLLRVWSVPNDFGHVIEGSEWSEEGIRTLVQTEPEARFQRAEEVLELLIPAKSVEPVPLPSNRELTPGETYDLFEIEKLHAQGGHSQIYSAFRGSQRERLALKVFNADVSQDRAQAELKAAKADSKLQFAKMDLVRTTRSCRMAVASFSRSTKRSNTSAHVRVIILGS